MTAWELSRTASSREAPGGASHPRPETCLEGGDPEFEIANVTIETHEIDIRAGGSWRFDMVGPGGVRYDNRMTFLRIERPHLIEVDHGSDKDDDPGKFRMLVTFDEQTDGKTVLTLRQMHPTRARRDAGIGFGAVEFGYQTLDKLADHVAARKS